MAAILIVGGGFGGMAALRELRHRLPRGVHSITLVSDEPHFVFRPSLLLAAFGFRRPEQIRVPIGAALAARGVAFQQGAVDGVDVSRRRVYAPGAVYRYDFLILAMGAEIDWDAVPGAREHAQSMMTIDQAVRARRALQGFRGGEAVVAVSPETICVGAAYELAFNLHFYLLRRGLRRSSRITLISYEAEPVEVAGPTAVREVRRRLEALGIRWQGKARVVRAGREGVELDNGEQVPCELFFILPPYRPRRLLGGSADAPQDAQGYLRTDNAMRLFGREDVFVVGDAAATTMPRSGHVATVQGKVAAANLAAALAGRDPVAAFRPEMLCILDMGARRAMLAKGSPAGPELVLTGSWVRPLKYAFERWYLAGLRHLL